MTLFHRILIYFAHRQSLPLSAGKIEEPILPGQRGVEGVEPPRPEVEQGGHEEPGAAAGLRFYDPPHRTARLGLDPTDNKFIGLSKNKAYTIGMKY